MGFFSRGDHEDAEQSESLARIEQGGIPAGAERRLQELATEGSPFTSGLSVGEFALLDRMGPRGPLKTVAQTGRNVELPNYTQALYHARELAMQRMQTEAQQLEAQGIVGVTLS
jgi:hypothetical protein